MLFEAFNRRIAAKVLKAHVVLLASFLTVGVANMPAAEARTHASDAESSPYDTGAIVLNEATGEVMYSRNADRKLYPASMTKVMTLYMTFEALRDGRLDMNTPLKVSKHASTREPSKLWLKAGSTIPVEDAILAIVTKSANDVATVLAEAIGDTEENFALLMTAKARELGMRNTVFRNASGLPDGKQVSTPRDMAVLGVAIHRDFPDLYDYFKTRTFTYNGKTLTTHNRFVKNYKGADGIKTGYIRASGFNLLAAAERDGHRLVGVVFGGRTAKLRDDHMAEIMDASFTLASGPPRAKVEYVDLGSPAVARDLAEAMKDQPKVTPVKVAGFSGDASSAGARVVTMQAVADLTPAAAEVAPIPADEPEKTLQMQAASLDEAAEDGITQAAPGWAVQVGAFSRKTAASDFGREVLSRVASGLDHVSATVSLAGGKKQLYRSRLVGFASRSEAQQTCAALKRGKVNCILVAPGTTTASLQ
jgi:D-alanyl-D-alanine carboxypeptidase